MRLILIALAGLFGSAAPAFAQDPPPLSAYGALPAYEFVQVSPTGERLAFVTVTGNERALVVRRLSDGQILHGARPGDAKVRDLEWVGDDALVTTTSATESLPGMPKTEFTMGQLHDIGTGRMTQVFDNQPGMWRVLAGPLHVRQTPDGAVFFVAGYNEVLHEVNLYRIDPATGRARLSRRSEFDVEAEALNPDGTLIARSRYDERRKTWSLHTVDAGGKLNETWSVVAPIDTPTLLGSGRTAGTILVHTEGHVPPEVAEVVDGEDRRDGVYEVDIATGRWTRLDFDQASTFIMRHPETRLMIGTGTVGDEGVTYGFIDPSAARVWSALSRAFDGMSPQLASWSDDFRSIVVFTAGSGDAGMYHLVDLDTKASRIIGEAYPDLTPDKVGAVRSIRYKAADGLDIHGYLTLPPGVTDAQDLPLIVLAHGGPASRDVMGFDWWSQAMASRGYAVLQANFRGSSGYGQDFMEAGYGEWGRKMQTDLSDGVRWLTGQGIVDPKRVCIVGASYGGYAALAGVTLDKPVYRCAVAVSGVTDLRRMNEWEARQGVRRDTQAVRYWNRFMGVESGNDRSLDARSPARLADTIDAPVMLLHGRDDTVVPIEQSRVMASALRSAGKPVEMIELAGEDHWLSRPETRTRMLTESLRFLLVHNPPD